MEYKGYRVISDEKEIADFYQGDYPTEDILENEYIIIDGTQKDFYCKHNGKIVSVEYPTLYHEIEGVIKPRNPQQQCAMDLLLNPESKIKLLRGVYGSGKDYLMRYGAIHLIERGKFNKIIFVRPHITVAGLPDIGALPGTAEEKLEWCLGPFYDMTGGREETEKMLAEESLEIVPLHFIRGRSFRNSIIYVTEGQNMTTEMVKLLIGRVGEGSELWINGDCHKQVDREIFKKDNGITTMLEAFKGHPLFGYVYLPTTERSEVAKMCDILDNFEIRGNQS